MTKKPKIKKEYQHKYERCLKISELIKELQAIKKEHGDLPVGHIDSGLEVYWSPRKIKEWGSEKAFPDVVRASNIRYWEKDSPMVAIIDFPGWGWKPISYKDDE